RRAGAEGVPVLAQDRLVEQQGDSQGGQPGEGPSGQDAPAAPAHGPQEQGGPEQVGQVRLEAQQGGAGAGPAVLTAADEVEEAGGAEQEQGRDLPGGQGEVGGQEREGERPRQPAQRGRPTVGAPQQVGGQAEGSQVEHQPQEVGGAAVEQAEGHHQRQRPG